MTLKKLCFAALGLLLAVTGAVAQNVPGSWTAIPTFGNPLTNSDYTNVVETPSRTFVLAGGFLMAVSDGETCFYNTQNKLSDSDIAKIQYNYAKGYLFIGYKNGNIDLLYDNDRVVNMPEIKDAMLTTSHEIGNVDFGSDRIVIATQFGIVIYDDVKHEVVESGIYNTSIKNAMIMGDKLVLYPKSGEQMLVSPLNQRHPRLEDFEGMLAANGNAQMMWDDIYKLSDNSFVRYYPSNKGVYKYTIGADGRVSAQMLVQLDKKPTKVCIGDDMLAFTVDTNVLVLTSDGGMTQVAMPSGYSGSLVFTTTDASSVWAACDKGVSRLNLSGDQAAVTMDWLKPNASSVVRPAQLIWSADNQYLYIVHLAGGVTIPNTDVTMQVCKMDRSGNIVDVSVAGLKPTHRIGIDPDDPDLFYEDSNYNGLRVFDQDGMVFHLTAAQAPYCTITSVKTASNVTFDPEGNMWMICIAGSEDKPLNVLPSAKRQQGDWENLTPSDWLVHPAYFTGFSLSWDAQLVFSKKRPYAVLTNSGYDGGYIVINHNNTYLDFSDDSVTYHRGTVDQTGASPGGSQGITWAVEDREGQIWLGTFSGVMVIPNPADAMDSGYTLTRPLVARNDGTNYGDYLLSTEKIYCIAVDHINRKWIATEASGVYLVSADGTEILEHFTPDNSPLPANAVYAITVDPEGSAVYMGTDYGLYVYNGSSSPSAADYSDVYIYPNPVRPEYTGNVVISGLMENSLVKIADAAGNVVYTTTSEGGSVVWDVCNSAGRRVRSGVYFVLASQNQQGATGVVGKVMVIN